MEKRKIFTAKNLTVTAMMTAISYVLYLFVKFPLPMLFPSFLDMQFSELPAILTGFMLGPWWGGAVILIKCLLKLPFTSTFCVGELGDLLMGWAYVVPAALWYRKHRTKKGAAIALLLGTAVEVVVAIAVNGLVLIPFYAKAFDFGWDGIVGMMRGLFPKITKKTLMLYYLPLSVLPFNILRLSVCSLITFFVYKRLHRLIDRLFVGKSGKAEEAAPSAAPTGDDIHIAQSDENAGETRAPVEHDTEKESTPPVAEETAKDGAKSA